jgi:hypothetical protein
VLKNKRGTAFVQVHVIPTLVKLGQTRELTVRERRLLYDVFSNRVLVIGRDDGSS